MSKPAIQGIVRADALELIRRSSERIETERRLPPEVVDVLRQAGVFRLCVPLALGGLQVAPADLLCAIETVAQADGSAGWCVMIGATSGLVSAFVDEPTGREIYGDAATISGGVFAPMGRASVEGETYRVSGRWSFASGCQHCSWLMGGCIVAGAAPLPNGAPDIQLVLFPAAAARVVDTWDVSGLRGTGSHDIVVDDLIIPQTQSLSLITGQPHYPGPLYAFPLFGLLAAGVAAVALGVARRAIEELTLLAGKKTPSASRRRLAERAMVQVDVARAEALVLSGRAFLFEAIAQAWDAARATGRIPTEQRARLRLAATNATTSAAQATDLMYTAGGGSSIYASNALQRCFRDVHVATQHLMVSSSTLELAGRILLGLETDTSQL